MKTTHICTDTTYKLIYQGYPVFLAGVTDLQKHFHPLCLAICTNEEAIDFQFIFEALSNTLKILYDYDYRPNALIADAAGAITNGFKLAFNYDNEEQFIRIMCYSHVDRAIKDRKNTSNYHCLGEEEKLVYYYIKLNWLIC